MVEFKLKESNGDSCIYYVWPEKQKEKELVVEFTRDDIKVLNTEYKPFMSFYISHVFSVVREAQSEGKELPDHGVLCWY